MRRHPASVIPQKRIFECSACGCRSPATKWRGQTHPGHVKTMYCYKCRKETDHIQVE
nr:MAG TPA: 50S ribosomal protein bL37 [Caudoviricetes sp.]